jgi:hypothetical protein
MWFRIFGTRDGAPEPAALLEHLHTLGIKVEGHFKGDDLGWFHVDFVLPDDPAPLTIDRYLAEEDEIRDQLNAWAAWLETQDASEAAHRLMQMMIEVQQIFTLQLSRERADEPPVRQFCGELCRYLAGQTKGVFQLDNQGFFGPEGQLLVKESS